MKTNRVFLGGVGLLGLLGWASQQTLNLHSEALITASPERVWKVIADTAAYPQWNPVIVRLEGKLQPGQSIEFENHSADGRSMIFRPTVLKADAGRELRWLGRLALPGLFDGEHYFVLTPLPDGTTRLQHGEHFKGVLIPLTRQWLKNNTQNDFTRINAALKARAEQLEQGI